MIPFFLEKKRLGKKRIVISHNDFHKANSEVVCKQSHLLTFNMNVEVDLKSWLKSLEPIKVSKYKRETELLFL